MRLNCEDQSSLRTDSSTHERGSHDLLANLLTFFTTIHRRRGAIHSTGVISAYFQARPFDRVILIKLPRGGLPGIGSGHLVDACQAANRSVARFRLQILDMLLRGSENTRIHCFQGILSLLLSQYPE